MKKQLFLMAAIVSVLAATQVMAWSYNLDEFVLSTDDVDSINISNDGNFVVWTNMSDMSLRAYDLSAKAEVPLLANNVDPMTISIGGNYLAWRDMMDMNYYCYDMLTEEQFIITRTTRKQ